MLSVSLYSEWSEQRRQFKEAKAAFARSTRRRIGTPIIYLEALASPFLKFALWLYSHVRMLKDEGFPVSRQLVCLHCEPSKHAFLFNSMWAFGCHFTCSTESGLSVVAFDCGIAAIPPSQTCTEIDVGIMRNIILVTYMGLNCVVMEGSWIKSIDQGRRVVKKDPFGFWTVQYDCREVRAKDNP